MITRRSVIRRAIGAIGGVLALRQAPCTVEPELVSEPVEIELSLSEIVRITEEKRRQAIELLHDEYWRAIEEYPGGAFAYHVRVDDPIFKPITTARGENWRVQS